MGWTAPRTWVTGEVVTAAQLNEQVRDNENALKGYLDDVTQTDVTGTRAINGTTYQNTSGKIKHCAVSVILQVQSADATLGGTSYVSAYCDVNATPVLLVAEAWLAPVSIIAASGTPDIITRNTVTFIVKPNDYYKIVSTNTGDGVAPTLDKWIECDLL